MSKKKLALCALLISSGLLLALISLYNDRQVASRLSSDEQVTSLRVDTEDLEPAKKEGFQTPFCTRAGDCHNSSNDHDCQEFTNAPGCSYPTPSACYCPIH